MATLKCCVLFGPYQANKTWRAYAQKNIVCICRKNTASLNVIFCLLKKALSSKRQGKTGVGGRLGGRAGDVARKWTECQRHQRRVPEVSREPLAEIGVRAEQRAGPDYWHHQHRRKPTPCRWTRGAGGVGWSGIGRTELGTAVNYQRGCSRVSSSGSCGGCCWTKGPVTFGGVARNFGLLQNHRTGIRIDIFASVMWFGRCV